MDGKHVVYKLKHISSGLFYDPQRYEGNVSEQGKVYSRKRPSRQSCIKIPYGVKAKNGFDITTLKEARLGWYKTPLEDWEVVEYYLEEKK